MRKLSTYTEYTLMSRHYVFVPGIGGFLLRDIDASYSNNIFTPSHREVHFNRFLTNDDGMLASAYMMAEGISFEEAIAQIRLEVAGILSALDKNKGFEFGNLGTLSYDSDHHLVIKKSKHFPLDPDAYGLRELNMRSWKEVEEEKEQSNDAADKSVDTVNISIPAAWVRRAVACIAVILCFFLNFNNSDKSHHTDHANIFSTDAIFSNMTSSTLTEESREDNCETETTLAKTENFEIKEKIETTELFDKSSDNTVVAVLPEKLYYIIIASCTSAAEAERVIKKRQKEGYENLGVLESDGRFRIYLKSFTDRTQGEAFLEEVRSTTPFQKAWLLPVRQESLLSLYLKKLDNDQLPMELSHPYQRTERDQGWINT